MKRLGLYKRVSTDRQDTAMQQHAIDEWLAARGTDHTVTVYQDEAMSGAKAKRPAYNRLCDDVKAGKVDVVVVYRLDRLSRDAITALRVLMDWTQAGIEFVAVSQPILSVANDDAFRLTKLAMFAELAQIERQTLITRVKTGMAAARARGVRLGAARKLTPEQRAEVRKMRGAGLTLRAIAKRFGVSHHMVSNIVREGEDHAAT